MWPFGLQARTQSMEPHQPGLHFYKTLKNRQMNKITVLSIVHGVWHLGKCSSRTRHPQKKWLDLYSQPRWRRRQTQLAPSHSHNKITTKTQNNHCSEPAEVELNGILTATELKKPHPSRLVGGAQTRNRLVPHPRVVDEVSGGLSWSQPRVLVPGR